MALRYTSVLFICILIYPSITFSRLAIEFDTQDNPILTYQKEPVLAYGPSPQHLLNYLPAGMGNDYKDWCEWAVKYKYGNVRSYPPSFLVFSPANNVFEYANDYKARVDLTKFNQRYFDELRKACTLFRNKGIIVHLQLWQAVNWKKAWERSYYNPRNNVNPDISNYAGPDYFVTMENPALLTHQKEYVRHILDATGDLGNVFYDIMNEIGNGTGVSEQWVLEIIDVINDWEREKKIDVLITLNDEGGKRMGNFSLVCDRLDLIVQDSGRYEDHVTTREKINKPTVTVRNIDFDYKDNERNYFFGKKNLELTKNKELQIRGRKYWWRMYMAGVYSAAGYADSVRPVSIQTKIFRKILTWIELKHNYHREASYRLNDITEKHFLHFRNFIKTAGVPKDMNYERGIISDHPVANSYCIQNRKRAVIYLESHNGKAGYIYPPASARIRNLSLTDGKYKIFFYHPDTGVQSKAALNVLKGNAMIQLPGFNDDLALLIE